MENFSKEWLFNPAVGKIIAALAGVLVVITLVKVSQRTLSRRIKDSDTRYRTRKFVTFLGYLLGILIVAAIFSDKLGGLTIAFGVAGAGVAFALQEVIASIAGWFAIVFSNFYKTGDRIQLGGIKGDVVDVGVLRTTLMEVGEWVKGDLYSGRVVRVANGFIFKEPVFNYSGDFPFLWDEIVLPIKYGSDLQRTRQLLTAVANELLADYATQASAAWKEMVGKFLLEDARVEPMVTMTGDENWLSFTVRYVVDYKKRRTTKDLLFTRILEEIDKTEGEVALAGATLAITETPTIDVHISPRE